MNRYNEYSSCNMDDLVIEVIDTIADYICHYCEDIYELNSDTTYSDFCAFYRQNEESDYAYGNVFEVQYFHDEKWEYLDTETYSDDIMKRVLSYIDPTATPE